MKTPETVGVRRGVPTATAPVRQWPRKELFQGVTARITQSPATVLNVSYGGLRLAMPERPTDAPLPTLEINLPALGVTVHARLVWVRQTATGAWSCGAELAETDPEAVHTWRGFVDALG